MRIVSSLKNSVTAGTTLVKAHPFITGAALLALIGGGWFASQTFFKAPAQTRYVLGEVTRGTIIATVTGAGQVSSSRQLDIKPEVSGTVTYVAVKPGEKVEKGQLLFSIDSADAQKALRDAQNNLESAQLSLEKLTKPASGLTLTQAQNAVSNAEDSLTKTYSTTQSDTVAVFLDMPDLMTSLQDVVIGTGASRGSQWNVDYYYNAIISYEDKARTYRDDAYNSYVTAKAAYDKTFAEYQLIGNNPTNEQVETMAKKTNDMMKLVSDALKKSNAFLQLYSNTITNRNGVPSSTATAALSSISSDIQSTNTRVSNLTSDITSIKTSTQSLTEKKQSLQELTDGADPLDVRTSALTVSQRQDAVADAQRTLAKYAVRAPFAGTISAVSVYVGDEAGGSAAATLVTPQQIAKLSVNEIDAAKVAVGNKATLTFDAIEDLTLTGTVAQIDTVGAVSQGVVSYAVQIAFDTQDARIKPGMTVNAAIQTATKQDVLVVPSSAVKTQNGTSYIQIFSPALESSGSMLGVTTDRTPTMVEVTTGISDDTNVEVVTGLTEGQQIIERSISSTASSNGSATIRTQTTGATRAGGNAGFGGATMIRL